jgi:c-di-GMP-binding flagellar brake protein YcgR
MNARDTTFVERRRSPRVEVGPGASIDIQSSRAVQVLDISLGGLMLKCTKPFPIGTRGRLSFALAGRRLSTDVEVRSVSVSADELTYRVGACFLDLSEENGEAIRRLLPA